MPTIECVQPVLTRPPNWGEVPFHVECPRCARDLRGGTEPKCPACGLEFAWDAVCPAERLTCEKCGYHLFGLREQRCPECGDAFTWEGALRSYHQRNKLIFEYRWRDRPVRSLIRTWWLALRPKRLWSEIQLHDPPRVGALVGFCAVGLVLIVAALGLVYIVGSILSSCPIPWIGQQPRVRLVPISATDCIIQALPLVAQDLWGADWPSPACAVGVYMLASVGALLIFQQSMSRCRVRQSQVLRICSYSIIVWWVPLTAALAVIGEIYAATWWYRAPDLSRIGYTMRWMKETLASNPLPDSALLLAAVFWSAGLRTLHVAYRDYLRMPHALGVAVASQTIAVLATAAVMLGIPNIIWLLW